MTQEGGKIIGQGSYGCVFSSPLLCKNKAAIAKGHRLGKVSKVDDIKNEVQAAIDLKGKPYSELFILPDTNSICVPAPFDQQVEPDIDKCEPFERIDPKQLLQYEMPFGGQTIRIVSSTPQASFSFVTFMGQLLEVGAALIVNRYVHNDFHTKNVLLDKGAMHLIDFGKSFSVTRITNEMLDERWTSYGPEFAYEAPDMSLVIALHEKVDLEKCIKDMHDTKTSMISMERVLGVSRKDQLLELIKFWNSSKAAQKNDWVAYWKSYWPTIDAWAIGAILIDILKSRLSSPEFVQGGWAKHQEVIEGVIKGLLHSSPRKRLDCLEALALFNPMHPLVTGLGAKWLAAKRRGTQASPSPPVIRAL